MLLRLDDASWCYRGRKSSLRLVPSTSLAAAEISLMAEPRPLPPHAAAAMSANFGWSKHAVETDNARAQIALADLDLKAALEHVKLELAQCVA